MTTETNKALVRRLLEEVFPAADLGALDEIVAPDLVDHSPVPGQPEGVEGVRHVLRGLHAGYSDLQITIDDLFGEGDRVAARWTLRGTHSGSIFSEAPTGSPVENGILVVFRVANGKITERWAAHLGGAPPARP